MKSFAGIIFGMGCAIGFALALAASFLLAGWVLPFFRIVSPMSLGVVLTLSVVVLAARRRGWLEASVVALTLVVFFYLAATCAIDLQLENTAFVRARDFYFSVVAGGGVVVLALAASAFGLVASWLSRTRALPFTLLVFRILAIVALVASTITVVLSTMKSRAAIEMDELRARIELPMCLPAISRDAVERKQFWREGRAKAVTVVDDEVRLTHVGEFFWNTCGIQVEPVGEHGPRGWIDLPSATALSKNMSRLEGPLFAECPAVCVARSRNAQLWFVAPQAPYEMAPFVLFGPPFSRHGGDIESFAPDLAPPSAWIALALVGVLAASLFVIVAWSRRDRRLEAALGWIEVTMAGVPMLRSPAWQEGLYRGSPTVLRSDLLVWGTRAELERRLAHSKAGIWAFAFAIVAVSGAPLAAAARYGLIF